MVCCGRCMYKLVHDTSESSNIVTSYPKHFVMPKRYNQFNQLIFMCNMVHCGPLKGRSHLKTLVKKVKLAQTTFMMQKLKVACTAS